MAVSATFNISDLSPHTEDNIEDPSDLRANPLQEKEVDVDQKGPSNPNEVQAIVQARGD